MSVIVKLLSKFDDSGIRKAKGSFSGLKGAIGAIGIGVGISQITDLLLDSAKAASGDAKSTKLLNTQLVRNAGATKAQIKQSDKFIEKLSLQTGILDDDLRPAYAKFGNVTHNVKDAQKLLTITIDAAAGSGKSQTKIAQAVAKAYDGNTKSLQNMFPELKKSKDVLGDFTTEYEGMAAINADPFMKFNNSMDILKEKLGAVILPLLSDFVDYISKPGGPIDQMSAFLDSFQDPNSDASKMFTNIKDAVKDAFGHVKDFFALFGNGDAMKGFGNVVKTLVMALPALIALKGIMVLASAGKAVAGLVTAMKAIAGANAASSLGGVAGAGAAGISVVMVGVAAIAATQFAAAVATGMADASIKAALAAKGSQATTTTSVFSGSNGQTMSIPNTGDIHDLFGFKAEAAKNAKPNNIINITVTNADPKATVDAIAKYVKLNGALPSVLTTGKYGR